MALLRKVSVLFSNVSNIDTFSNKFQLVVSLTEDQAADAEQEGIKVKTKEYDGKTQYQATFKTKFPVRIVDASGKKDVPLNGSEIGRGSLVNLSFKMRDFVTPSKETGVSQDLTGVQILAMESVNASEFEAEEGFEDASGDF